MANLMMFAAHLYGKLRGAEPATRDRVQRILREAMDTGVIPLGVHDKDGAPAYWWLVYESGKFPTDDALQRHIDARTPTGLPKVVLTL